MEDKQDGHTVIMFTELISVQDPNEVVCTANMFLNRLIGAHIYLLPKTSHIITDITPRMDQLVQKIK